MATHFLLLALGSRSARSARGASATLAGIMLGLTFLCQFVYGYMGALSICLLALLPGAGIPRLERLRRVLWIGAVALLLSAFQLVPLWLDRALINRTPAGPGVEVGFLRRRPGAGMAGHRPTAGQRPLPHPLVACPGRPDRSLAAILQPARNGTRRQVRGLPAPLSGSCSSSAGHSGVRRYGCSASRRTFHLHRVLGGAQIFLVVLAAIGLAAIWSELSRRVHVAAAVSRRSRSSIRWCANAASFSR